MINLKLVVFLGCCAGAFAANSASIATFNNAAGSGLMFQTFGNSKLQPTQAILADALGAITIPG